MRKGSLAFFSKGRILTKERGGSGGVGGGGGREEKYNNCKMYKCSRTVHSRLMALKGQQREMAPRSLHPIQDRKKGSQIFFMLC